MICKHCKHEWNYNGKQTFFCTCPNCLYKVKIPKTLNFQESVNNFIGKNGRKN